MSLAVPLHGFGSGGTLLDFMIIPYYSKETLLAANPPDNRIGVVTTKAISSWCFSSVAPSDPKEGMLWIAVGSASVAAFNALGRNVLQIYPLYAKQYIDGAWVYVDVRSRKDGAWIEWTTDIMLYSEGNEFVTLALKKVEKKATYLDASLTPGGSATITSDPIVLSGHAKVSVTYSRLTGSGTFAGGFRVRVKTLNGETVKESPRKTATSGTVELDISELNLAGNFVIEVYVNNTSDTYSGSCQVSEIKVLR